MKRVALFAAVVCVFAMNRSFAIRPSTESSKAMTTIVAIGTLNGSSEKNDLDLVDGVDFGGEIYFYLNGDPLCCFRNGGDRVLIDSLVARGRNEITFSGRCQRPFYMKVGQTKNLMTSTSFDSVITSAVVQPEGLNEGIVAWTSSSGTFNPHTDLLDSNKIKNGDYRQELKMYVSALRNAVSGHNRNALKDILYPDQTPLYGRSIDINSIELQKVYDRFCGSDCHLEEETKPLEVEFGKRLVRISTQPCDVLAPYSPAYLVRSIDSNKDEHWISAMCLFRKNGKWYKVIVP